MVDTAVEVRAPVEGRFSEVLTPAALDFLAELQRRFNPQRKELLGLRAERQERFKAGEKPDFLAETQAVRDGDWKYLRIGGNEFLFDVSEDPRERANLKRRRQDVFARLKAEWEAWNGTMLPEMPEAFSESPDGSLLADHFDVRRAPGRE